MCVQIAHGSPMFARESALADLLLNLCVYMVVPQVGLRLDAQHPQPTPSSATSTATRSRATSPQAPAPATTAAATTTTSTAAAAAAARERRHGPAGSGCWQRGKCTRHFSRWRGGRHCCSHCAPSCSGGGCL